MPLPHNNVDLEMVVPLVNDGRRVGAKRGTSVIPISETLFVPTPM